MDKKFFSVNVNKYDPDKDFEVYWPASLDHPKDHAVMFITKSFLEKAKVFEMIHECLIFWPEEEKIPQSIHQHHVVSLVKNPHLSYCKFFQENHITNLPEKHPFHVHDGAYIEDGASIGENCTIFPGAYIGYEVEIGNHCYIGAGVKIVGRAKIGDHVVIRENTVIGADSMTIDRDENGRAVTMPQFGGIVIANDVQIGANTIIGRGAIDDTVISRGSKISNNVSVCHNVYIGEDTFVVGESIMLGSSSVGDRVLISTNSVLSNYVHIGNDSIIGQSAMVNQDIPAGTVAFGIPTRVIRKK